MKEIVEKTTAKKKKKKKSKMFSGGQKNTFQEDKSKSIKQKLW